MKMKYLFSECLQLNVLFFYPVMIIYVKDIDFSLRFRGNPDLREIVGGTVIERRNESVRISISNGNLQEWFTLLFVFLLL